MDELRLLLGLAIVTSGKKIFSCTANQALTASLMPELHATGSNHGVQVHMLSCPSSDVGIRDTLLIEVLSS